MLPDGFEWHRDHGWYRLMYGTRTLATVTLIDDGGSRIATNPDDNSRRFTFRPTFEAGVAYVEAWACKWDARIREGGDSGPMLYGPGLMDVPAAGQVQTTHRRRRRR